MKSNLKTPPYLSAEQFRKQFRPSKSLGQHFLKHYASAEQIVAAASPLDNCQVVEIGPGQGMLTQALLCSSAEQITVIEKDPRMLPFLEHLAKRYPNRLTVVINDALNYNYQTGRKIKIVANLPYNIATALITKWLREIENFSALTVMVQKEVADRFTANPKSAAYGSLSVLAQWLCLVEEKLTFSPEMFSPQPKVTSKVITFTPRTEVKKTVDFACLSEVLAICFRHRRKLVIKSLHQLFGEKTESIMEALAIPPTSRAQEIKVRTWCQLAELYRR